MTMKSFLFDLGDSTKGPIGYCARVRAPDMEHAVQILKNALDRINCELDIHKTTGITQDFPAVEYITVYFNTKEITWKAIDDEEDAEGDAS